MRYQPNWLSASYRRKRRGIEPRGAIKFTREAGTPLSADELAMLAALKDRPIDLSDIPESPADAVWMRAVPNVTNKQAVSLRLDPDVLDYFRHTGKRYQTLINNVLRAYMHAQK